MSVCVSFNYFGAEKRIENLCFKTTLEATALVFSLENSAVNDHTFLLYTVSWNVYHLFLLLSFLMLDYVVYWNIKVNSILSAFSAFKSFVP